MRPLFLVLLLIALSPATRAEETLYSKRKSNAIREGAGSYYTLLASVPENTPLAVLARSGSWVKVQLPDKQVGWIASSSLKTEKGDAAAAGSPEPAWTSPRALSAAIKGFGKQYVRDDPGSVDSVLHFSEKGFTREDLEAFTEPVRRYPSSNRERLDLEDLDLGNPGYEVDLPEQQIGVSIAARIAGKGVVGDPELRRYVNLVCAAVAGQSALYDMDLTVLVLNDRSINAFAVPAGFIFVTAGLLAQCRDEAELAGVIAHEIAHISRRHGLQELGKRVPGIRAEGAFAELEEEVGGPTEDDRELQALADHTYEKIVRPRLLSYELEADRIGAVLAANAGYDPFALVRISERVAHVAKERPEIFDADYMLPDDAAQRARDIRSFADKNFAAENPGAQLRERFASAVAPLR